MIYLSGKKNRIQIFSWHWKKSGEIKNWMGSLKHSWWKTSTPNYVNKVTLREDKSQPLNHFGDSKKELFKVAQWNIAFSSQSCSILSVLSLKCHFSLQFSIHFPVFSRWAFFFGATDPNSVLNSINKSDVGSCLGFWTSLFLGLYWVWVWLKTK